MVENKKVVDSEWDIPSEDEIDEHIMMECEKADMAYDDYWE